MATRYVDGIGLTGSERSLVRGLDDRSQGRIVVFPTAQANVTRLAQDVLLALGKRPMQDAGWSDQARLWDYAVAWIVGDRIRHLFVQHAETVEPAALGALLSRLGDVDDLVVWILSERRDGRIQRGGACRLSAETFLESWSAASSPRQSRTVSLAARPAVVYWPRSPALFDLTTLSSGDRPSDGLAAGVSTLVASLAGEADTDAEYEAALRGVGGTLSLFGVRFDHRHVRAFPRAAARALAHLISRESLARFTDPTRPASLALAVLTGVDARRLRAIDVADLTADSEVLSFDGVELRLPETMAPSVRALIALRGATTPATQGALFTSMRPGQARITSVELHELIVNTAAKLSLPLPAFHPRIVA